MRSYCLLAVLIALCVPQYGFAQDMTGVWRGLIGSQQNVLTVSKSPDGQLHGVVYKLGFDAGGNPTSTITITGKRVTFDLDHAEGAFDGVLAPDGQSIFGNWTAFGQSQPLKIERASAKTREPIDPSPHKALFESVEPGVQLEVLDWGGNGPPLVFLAGGGNTAHVFDSFAPKFTNSRHVYGITRRGFGMSNAPAATDANYDSDRLGDDVLSVIAILKLERPVVVGHSIAGGELSSLGSRHADKIAGLIYLDAVSDVAYYGVDAFTFHVDSATVRRALGQLAMASPGESRALIAEIQSTLPRLQKGLTTLGNLFEGAPDGTPLSREAKWVQINQALLANPRRYTDIKIPALALMAVPHACAPNCDNQKTKETEAVLATNVDAFEAGVPSARVIRVPYANHFIFRSDEALVLREMMSFMEGLKSSAK